MSIRLSRATNLVTEVSRGEVVERGPLLALGNILGLGESIVPLLRAGLREGNDLGPVSDHVLGQLTDLVDVLADAVDGLLLNLPVGDGLVRVPLLL